jgi:hypothetical protein
MRSFIVWQRVEGVLVVAAGLGLFWWVESGWAWWLAIPAYAFGPRVGAFGYNLVHVYGFGLLLFAVGLVAALPVLMACGALFLAHAGFDRMLGYGLKSPEGFAHTHLGRIGKGV